MKNRKRKKRWMAAILTAVLVMGCFLRGNGVMLPEKEEMIPCSLSFSEKKLVPVGKTVGLKLFAHGVMVVGLDEVTTETGRCSPAKESGLKVGDIITSLNGKSVNTIEEVEALLTEDGDKPLAVTAMRGGRTVSVTANAVPSTLDGHYQLGAWIRDSMAGIGTVSWYDPDTGAFCALGHGINDVDTALLMPLKGGGIMKSSVTGIQKGSAGHPGQLHGTFDLTEDMGTLSKNTDCGVFGTLTKGSFEGEALPLAKRSEVKTGAAVIRSNISGEEVQEYSVEILRIYPENGSDTRNLMIQVTDERLLRETGGIVQGMSGSPILQNGKLVGSVTHVLINDATRGYGILIENMLNAAES